MRTTKSSCLCLLTRLCSLPSTSGIAGKVLAAMAQLSMSSAKGEGSPVLNAEEMVGSDDC